jgi:hypothetical protein
MNERAPYELPPEIAAMIAESTARRMAGDIAGTEAEDERRDDKSGDAERFKPVALTHSTTQSSHTQNLPTSTRSQLSNKGMLIADREPDTLHDPAYQEPVMLTSEEKAAGKKGLKIMQAALEEERSSRKPWEDPRGPGLGPGK